MNKKTLYFNDNYVIEQYDEDSEVRGTIVRNSRTKDTYELQGTVAYLGNVHDDIVLIFRQVDNLKVLVNYTYGADQHPYEEICRLIQMYEDGTYKAMDDLWSEHVWSVRV